MTSHDQTWLSIREAALRLGTSELTIRRRIKDGRLQHRLEGGKYFVFLGDAELRESDVSTPAPDAPPQRRRPGRDRDAGVGATDNIRALPLANGRQAGGIDNQQTDTQPKASGLRDEQLSDQSAVQSSVDVSALLTDYARLAEAAGRAEQLERSLRELQEQHATLQESVVSLATRNGWLESKLDEREHEIKLLTDSNHRVSWWKRLFGAGS
jgi:excisionase family DNA binding protein